MLIVGTILLVNQQINVGQFIAADIVIITIIGSVEKVIISLDTVYDALVSVEKLGKITEADTETGGNLLLENLQQGLSVEFINTSFTYPDGNKVLENINFSIDAGQMIHIKGRSGSGKSTLLRLLTGAYKNFDGNLLIDGQPIDNYEIQSVRNATGILVNSQDIFTGSLLENITMGNADIDGKQVDEYVENIGLTAFVQSNKLGLYMLLDPVGKRLPREVTKKILLLRAILGRHRLLLLEEPFEYLSTAATDILLTWLKNLKHTTILIASNDEKISKECDAVLNL